MTKTVFKTTSPQDAIKLMENFINNHLHNYSAKRNYDYGPDNRTNISMLSPYIRHRIITEQAVIDKAINKFPLPKIEKFIQEILWRTYWKGWLELRPKLWEDYKNLVEDNHKKHELTDVLSCNTNIDCFDSWTKELVENNYLHNHARMWYASIWIHTLKLPWYLGADFFLNNLLDGDPASNTLSWRWVAGLQTKGKTYLAKAWNIQKYTNNRFTPIDKTLSSQPVMEPFVDYKTNSIKFHASEEFDWTNSGLLITTEDMDVLSCDKIEVPIKDAYILALTDIEEKKYSKSVSMFKYALAESTQNALSEDIKDIQIQSAGTNQIRQIIDWAKQNEMKNIVTLACPCGYVRDFINILKKELNKESINIIKLYRDYDMKYWNLASGSFFNFFKKAIRKI